MSTALLQYVSFYLDGTHFGVDVLRVQELLPAQQMTPVPRAPEDIRGLINLRGQIVPALDLRLRLGIPSLDQIQEAMNVIVHSQDGLVSLLVDSIGDVVTVSGESLSTSPDNLSSKASRYTTGVHQLPECLLIVLDVDRICGNETPAPDLFS